MPARTSGGKTPIIVYMEDEDHAALKRFAEAQQRTISSAARVLLHIALKQVHTALSGNND